jgi:hypothetical protein
MSLGDIYKARRPQQPKVAKPPPIPEHVKAALATDRAKSSRPRAPVSQPARPRPAPANPTEAKRDSYQEYRDRRAAEGAARAQATLAAIAEAANQQQPVQEQPQRSPVERVADEVVAVFAAAWGKGAEVRRVRPPTGLQQPGAGKGGPYN